LTCVVVVEELSYDESQGKCFFRKSCVDEFVCLGQAEKCAKENQKNNENSQFKPPPKLRKSLTGTFGLTSKMGQNAQNPFLPRFQSSLNNFEKNSVWGF
jgi:hypothetical protein